MKLKLVVASMSVLGLVSCPLFAATTTATKHHHKKKHHTIVRHHVVKRHEVKHHVIVHRKIMHREVRHHETIQTEHYRAEERREERREVIREERREEKREARVEAEQANYKGEVPYECTVSTQSVILDSITQNYGRALPDPCDPGWYDRVRLSGGVNVDVGKWGNRNGDIEGENYKRISINDAYINVAADINDWTNAFASLSYSNPTSAPHLIRFFGLNPTVFPTYGYSHVYDLDNISLEQAYFTIGNFDQSPFYLQAGKEFLDFGRYQIHPIAVPFTQVMSETLTTSLKLGFILDSGFNASIYAFNDRLRKSSDGGNPPYNYGFAAGYMHADDNFGYDLGGAYMRNIISVNDIAHAVRMFSLSDVYRVRVAGVALYGDVNAGPFAFNARWVSTIQRFNSMDLPRDGFADIDSISLLPFPSATGAKPWALSLEAGYAFNQWCKDNTVYFGYQTSRESAGIGLPKYRYLAGWDMQVFKYTNIGIEWDHDREYSYNQGGRNNVTDLFSIRTAVQFN